MNSTEDEQRLAASALSDVLREQHAQCRCAWLQVVTIAVVVIAAGAIAVLAILDHPHRAILVLVVLLYFLALIRAVWPGRPWFASRHRWMDVALYAVAGSAIWFLSPFTAMMLNVRP